MASEGRVDPPECSRAEIIGDDCSGKASQRRGVPASERSGPSYRWLQGAAIRWVGIAASVCVAASLSACETADPCAEGTTRLCLGQWREVVPDWDFYRATLVDRGDADLVIVAISQSARAVTVIDREGTSRMRLAGEASAIAAADVDGDGVDEVAIALALPASVVVYELDGRTLIERAAVAYETPPRDIVGGDVDGDGRAEFLTADGDAGTISTIALVGGVNDDAIRVATAVGITPFVIRAGDLNGDGLADVAALDFASGDLLVRMGEPGGLGPPRTWPVDPASTGLALGDVDGDEALDVVVSGLSPTLSILYGDGAGDLSAPFVVLPEFDELNERGEVDVAPLIVTPTAGSLGGIAVVRDNELQTTLLTTGGVPESGRARLGMGILGEAVALSDGRLLLHDIRGLGLVDIVDAPVPIERWRLVFNPMIAQPTHFHAGDRTVAVVDLDDDGAADLLVSHVWIRLYYGDGLGGFVEAEGLNIYGAQALAAADVNGDAHLDVIARSGEELFVARGEGGRAFSVVDATAAVADDAALLSLGDQDRARVAAVWAYASDPGGVALFSFADDAAPRPAVPLATDLRTRSASVADLDGDLAEDVVVLGRHGDDVGAPWALQAHLVATGVPTPQPVHELVDVDVDRRVVGPALGANLDDEPEALVVTEDGIHHVRGLDTGSPEVAFEPLEIALDSNADATLAEVDGDGSPDIALLFTNGGFGAVLGSAGGFTEALNPYTLPFSRIAAADVDGDGRVDLVGHAEAEISVLLQETHPSPRIRERWALPSLTSAVVGDLDGDGQLDLVHGGVRGVAVTFDPLGSGRHESLNLDDSAGVVAAVDLDGDGRDEGILVRFSEGTTFSLLRWVDGSLRVEPSPLPVGLRAEGRVDGPVFVDLDGDARLDVVALLDDRLVVAYGEAATGPWLGFGEPETVASGVKPPLMVGDASDDGLPELVATVEVAAPEDPEDAAQPAVLIAIAEGRHWQTRRVTADGAVIRGPEADLILRRDGALVRRPIYGTRVAPEVIVAEDETLRDGFLVGASDLDGDGESDVVCAYFDRLTIWRGRSGVLVREHELGSGAEIFGGVTLVDLDRDGRGEILVGRHLFSGEEDAP